MSPPSGPETRPVRFKQILIVDQDEAWARVIRDAVARGGYCAIVAGSVPEGIRVLREGAADLALISCLLDTESAEALLSEIQALPKPPPLVLVGFRDADTQWHPWRSRKDVTLVRQPFTTESVLEVVRTLLVSTWEDAPKPP